MEELNKLEPLRDLFNLLYQHLKGFNMTDEKFNFEYDNYTFTLIYRNNQIKLADDVDVYDEYDNFIGNFNLYAINNVTSIQDLKEFL